MPAKLGSKMCPYTPLLCAKFRGNQILRSNCMAVFVSVRKDEEKKNKEAKPIFEVSYLGNA